MARLGRREDPPLYETRCPNCDVSFPLETRTCIHCGGPTRQAMPLVFQESSVFSDEPYDLGVRDPTAPMESAQPDYQEASYPQNEPIEPTSESPFSIEGSIEGSIEDSVFGDGQTNDRELETSDGPPTLVGSLIRSLGSFIWVILLIAFSLARSCGE